MRTKYLRARYIAALVAFFMQSLRLAPDNIVNPDWKDAAELFMLFSVIAIIVLTVCMPKETP